MSITELNRKLLHNVTVKNVWKFRPVKRYYIALHTDLIVHFSIRAITDNYYVVSDILL